MHPFIAITTAPSISSIGSPGRWVTSTGRPNPIRFDRLPAPQRSRCLRGRTPTRNRQSSAMSCVMLLLLAGYVYVWRKGALDWGSEKLQERS